MNAPASIPVCVCGPGEDCEACVFVECDFCGNEATQLVTTDERIEGGELVGYGESSVCDECAKEPKASDVIKHLPPLSDDDICF